MSADRRDPSEAFTAEERQAWEHDRDMYEIAEMMTMDDPYADDDHYPIEDADFFDPTGGWDGWEEVQPD